MADHFTGMRAATALTLAPRARAEAPANGVRAGLTFLQARDRFRAQARFVLDTPEGRRASLLALARRVVGIGGRR